MTRKIARQSEVTPLDTVDEYLWNKRLGISQLPSTDPSQMQPNTSSLPPQANQPPLSSVPPQASQAPTIDFNSANSPSDMFGSGVSSEGQAISTPTKPMVPRSMPAVGKAASIGVFDLAKHLMDEHGYSGDAISNHEGNTKHHNEIHDMANSLNLELSHMHKNAAVSTLYGDVDPTPTTGESSNGSQSGRNNSSENLPNGPDASPAPNLAPAEEDAAGGLVGDLGEAASIAAFANKRWIGSVLDPKEASEEEGHYKYIKHRNGKWVIIQKGTGKVLSTHDTREKAISSFKAMMMSKHGG